MDLPQPGSNRGYDPADIVTSFWLSIWTGASRYIQCDWLRYDKVVQSIFGWEQMPSQSTYSRFFGKFSQKRNGEVFPVLQNWFFDQLGVDKITVDFDSTVITRYGEQACNALDTIHSGAGIASDNFDFSKLEHAIQSREISENTFQDWVSTWPKTFSQILPETKMTEPDFILTQSFS